MKKRKGSQQGRVVKLSHVTPIPPKRANCGLCLLVNSSLFFIILFTQLFTSPLPPPFYSFSTPTTNKQQIDDNSR